MHVRKDWLLDSTKFGLPVLAWDAQHEDQEDLLRLQLTVVHGFLSVE